MSYNQLPPGYDAWKLAYPPHWDHEPEEEEKESEEEPETFSGLMQCLDCHHIWDADEESACEHCGSDAIASIAEP